MVTKTFETASYELADIGTRFAALFIDGAILSIIGSAGFLTMRGVGLGTSFIIGIVYTWFFLTRNHGQTPGKMLMKIRVIKIDGSPINDSDAVIRYIGYFVNHFFFIGWLWALVDDNRQGWHDKMAQTYVVKTE